MLHLCVFFFQHGLVVRPLPSIALSKLHILRSMYHVNSTCIWTEVTAYKQNIIFISKFAILQDQYFCDSQQSKTSENHFQAKIVSIFFNY